MATSKRGKRRATAAGVSFETLEATPERVFRFLLGMSRSASIRQTLGKRGLDARERQHALRLLERVVSVELEDEEDEGLEGVIQTLDDWDDEGYELVRVVLTRFPEVRERLLDGLTPQTGTASVLGVATLLERLTALEGTEEGRTVLAHLASRGVDEALRQRLAGLVKAAQSIPDVAPSDAAEAYEAALVELRAWYEEWSGLARLVIKRRDHLVRLGLAERH